jgi:hypothetical protein
LMLAPLMSDDHPRVIYASGSFQLPPPRQLLTRRKNHKFFGIDRGGGLTAF